MKHDNGKMNVFDMGGVCRKAECVGKMLMLLAYPVWDFSIMICVCRLYENKIIMFLLPSGC
jgi:hypothetical protein